MTPRIHAVCGVVASAVVLLTIAWGFVLVGPPATRRLERFDEQRLEDLQSIVREIGGMVREPGEDKELKRPLPKSLEEAAKQASYAKLELYDPETGEPYGYTVKSETTFELCATFSLPRESDFQVFWNHPAGKHCFTIDILDPP